MNFNPDSQPKGKFAGLSRRHLIAIAVILALGGAGAAAILSSGPGGRAQSGHDGHAEHGDEHGHEPAAKAAPKAEAQPATQPAATPASAAKDDHAGDDHDHDHGEKKPAAGKDDHAHGAESGKDAHADHDEGPQKVALTPAQQKAAGITLATAEPGAIGTALRLPGEIRFNEDRTAHVVPRVAGVVESVQASLGQTVKRGQLLAVISSGAMSDQRSDYWTAQKRLALARSTHEREKKLWQDKISAEQDYQQAQQALREAEIAAANAQQKLAALGAGPGASSGSGLNRFELRAPLDGVIVEKHLALGEAVKEDAQVFTVSDLRSVWAEVAVAAKDLPKVRLGEKARVTATAFDASASGTVQDVGALLGEQTRTARARITLANPQGSWRPGLFVNVELADDSAAKPAAVTVASDALQTLPELGTVVFVQEPGGGGFVAQPVKTGRSDSRRTEITQGLKAGQRYAAGGSFVLKSELGKASAEHSH